MEEKINSNINQKRESEEKFKTLFYSLPEAVVYLDDKGRVLDINPKFTKLFGYTLEEIKGRNIDEGFLHPDYLIEEGRRLTKKSLRGPYLTYETVRKRKDGKLIHVSISASPVKVGNKTKGVLVIYQDISERKRMEEDIKYKATHDTLTGLANRSLLKYMFDLESARAKRERKKLALLLMDLYNFKDINDRFGHDVGDILLKEVARKLTDIFRKTDIIFRLGGDEFVILLTDIKKNGDLNRIVLRIIDSFNEPIKYETMEIRVGVNVGVTIFPDDGEDLDTLLKKADIAMYTAKELGPNTIRYFNEKLMDRWIDEKDRLMRGEVRYRTIFENSPLGIALIDKDGEILNVNQRFLKITGFKRENLINKNITDVFPCNKNDLSSTDLSKLKNNENLECETYIERNGEKIFLNVYISPILNPYKETEVEYLILMIEDITDKRRLEEELKFSLKKFRNLFEDAPLGINLTDKRGVFLDVNPQWERMLGYKREEVVGKKTWMDITHPEDLKRDTPLYQKYLEEVKDGKTFKTFVSEKRLTRKDGSVFWAKVIASPAFDEKGNFLFEVATIEDISSKKEEEIERKRLLKELKEEKTFSDTLKDAALKLTTITDLKGLLNEMLIQAKRLVPFVSGNVSLIEDDEIVIVASTGYEKYGIEKFVSNLRIPIDMYPTDEKVIETKKPLVISDTSKHPDWITYKETEWIKSHIIIPIIVKDEVIGFLKIDGDRINQFSKEDVEKLTPFVNMCSVIIERARVFEELKKEGKRYREMYRLFRLLADNVQDMIWAKDLKGRYIFVNKSICEKLLNAKSTEEPIGKTDLYFAERERKSHPDNPKWHTFGELCVNSDEVVLKTKKPGRFDEFGYVKGKYLHLDVYKAPLWDENGNLIGTVGTARDVTKEKYLEKLKEEKEKELKKSHERLRRAFNDIITILGRIVETKDPYTAGHQRRVAKIATEIAKEMKLNKKKIEVIRVASLVHDIGKIVIPNEILHKPGNLSRIEWEFIKMHPKVGYNLLKNIEFLHPVAQIVLEHHENIDGSGYPEGLKGDEILLEARIIRVADTLEAMTSNRPYRPAFGIDKALEEIKKNKGILYDPKVVEACIRLFEKGFRFE